MLAVSHWSGGGGGLAQVLVNPAAGTPVGDMTSNGGLAAAFDGVTSQANAACSARFATSGYVGKSWGAGVRKTITRYRYFAPSDVGPSGAGSVTLTYTLRGSDDGSSWTTLHTDSASVGAGGSVDVTSGITTTLNYLYHSVLLSVASGNIFAAEVMLYETV
ncbi:hypothetical protein [Ferrovibrio sp.]|uniref:hypothetical protein n=1 Tax=Ferrovibrio sp. TaxID=1917215 RepID=UPI00311F72CF